MSEPNFLKDVSLKKGENKVKKEEKKDSQRDSMAVNLVAQTVSQEAAKKSEKKVLYRLEMSFCIALVVAALAYAGLYGYGFFMQKSTSGVSEQLTAINSAIAGIEKKSTDLTLFQDRIAVSKTLLENHLYWSQFISEIEKNTAPNVTYDNLSVSTSNLIAFSAFAPDFTSVSRQYRAYQNATHLFSQVQISSADAMLNQTGDVIGVRFNVAFIMNPEVLKRK